jgi:hypothetical protein
MMGFSDGWLEWHQTLRCVSSEKLDLTQYMYEAKGIGRNCVVIAR